MLILSRVNLICQKKVRTRGREKNREGRVEDRERAKRGEKKEER